MAKSIAVFTGKNLEWLLKEGGSGYWISQGWRINEAEYLLCVRNHRETWAIKDDGVAHGQAFLIGRINGHFPSTVHKGRKVIQMSEYALLPIHDERFNNAWKKLTKGQRYPVSYKDSQALLDTLGIKVEELEWIPFQPTVESAEEKVVQALDDALEDTDDSKSLHQVIEEAKERVAQAAGVDFSQVTIKIDF